MTSTLPPDPYKLLGVTKDATTPEIRSAHRKLVLKCHPDKVQDAALKAIKQDEFQKVQQAYELLSDDSRRTAYDDQVKLFELRKEMGRGNPTARSNPFEYEVKTAEPRPNSYSKPSPKPYPYPAAAPRSREDVYSHEDPRHFPKRSTSYEKEDRRRREDELRQDAIRRKHEEDERHRAREREERKDRERRAHSDKKKSRDKERKRGSEEKRSRTTGVYVEDESSDDYRATRKEQATRYDAQILHEEALRAEAKAEALRQAASEAARASIKEAPLHQKWDSHRGKAEEYIHSSRRKASLEDDTFHHPGLNRAQTFAAPSPTAYKYAIPADFSDDDSPRRSSAARAQMRRSAEAPASSSRRKSRERERRRSPTHPNANIVEPPSPPPTSKRHATLQSHNSAPPQLAREKPPSRSKTSDYPRNDKPASLSRASTFQAGDGSRSSPRDTKGTRLREYTTVESESDSDNGPIHASPRQRDSYPPPQRPEMTREPTRYKVENGRSIPAPSRHRADLRELNINDDYDQGRDRSESPSTRTRPPLSRNPPSSDRHRSHSTSYAYQPGPEAPRVVDIRPKMPSREGASNVSYRVTGGPKYVTPGFEKINYAPRPTAESVVYSDFRDSSRRSGGMDREREKEYYGSIRGSGHGVYAQ